MFRYFLMAIFVLSTFSFSCLGQTVKTTKLNFLNPGIAWENPIGAKNTLETNAGIGYNGHYRGYSYSNSGWQVNIAPFFEVTGRHYYNLDKRAAKGRNSAYNSGNFISLRTLLIGPKIAGNVRYYNNHLFQIGPMWGFQRSKGKFNVLAGIGPCYYFDFSGGKGKVFPFMVELNLGFLHHRKKTDSFSH